MTKTPVEMINPIAADFMVEMKVAGKAITIDLAKVDESWLRHALMYGVRRFVNDKYSGATNGNEKYDLCRMLVDDMQSGEAMPETVRGAGSANVDPVTALAMKNAKAALQVVFKQVTGATKAIDFAEHEKIKPFFAVKDGKATWVDATVTAWMDKQAETKGGVDYRAQAKATIEGADDALKGLDLGL